MNIAPIIISTMTTASISAMNIRREEEAKKRALESEKKKESDEKEKAEDKSDV